MTPLPLHGWPQVKQYHHTIESWSFQLVRFQGNWNIFLTDFSLAPTGHTWLLQQHHISQSKFLPERHPSRAFHGAEANWVFVRIPPQIQLEYCVYCGWQGRKWLRICNCRSHSIGEPITGGKSDHSLHRLDWFISGTILWNCPPKDPEFSAK